MLVKEEEKDRTAADSEGGTGEREVGFSQRPFRLDGCRLDGERERRGPAGKGQGLSEREVR